ncbi:NADP-dependent 3-hydroxy acid dehydrogenase YdfG [Mucilaginibacter yixingensis]|uniref:NADP-dependent 3-hydroxy acid dehydrogenase YdfG n=1 Tax=Mucilaginibacter yixingensis TaxID=1295612 RepID=A0A2T5J955_9SPHI|nr:SDR family oxidoreductase [Mucilaginibacter yixingensis]PTQ96600.1 NADP-dependent 3-hydroxy acid dehydrogenase YdfG [Mucilaginibacter yixingensis]
MKNTILITGASSGFGRAAVKLFQEQGWNVVATMRSPEKEETLRGLENVALVRLDVTNPESIREAVAEATSRFGRIDVLVNNAGYGTLGALEAATAEVIRRQLDTNLIGVIQVTQAVLPVMRAQRAGVIINVSSVGGRATFPFSSLYHATKFAVEGLTESLQYELNPLGIRLKIVEPGGYKTDFVSRSMDYFGAGGIADYQQAFDRFAGKLETWPLSENIGEVADAIFRAATDGTEQLRYPTDIHGQQLLEARQQMDDVAFKQLMITQTLD